MPERTASGPTGADTSEIITAEALYPGSDPAAQTMRALGAASGPGGAVRPSATIFNGAMVLFAALGRSTALGIGGFERGISYPTRIRVTAFGGYLLGMGDELAATDYRE